MRSRTQRLEPIKHWRQNKRTVCSRLVGRCQLEAGFDPYSLQLANGPGSLAANIGVPVTAQNTNSNSSRAGQFYNSVGYVGVSSDFYGTLTVFRQNSLTLDAVIAYDPMAGSYAFSPLGFSGTTCGVGDAEICHFSTAVKYRANIGPVRVWSTVAVRRLSIEQRLERRRPSSARWRHLQSRFRHSFARWHVPATSGMQ